MKNNLENQLKALKESLKEMVDIKNTFFLNLPEYNILKFDALKMIDKIVEAIEQHPLYNDDVDNYINIVLER